MFSLGMSLVAGSSFFFLVDLLNPGFFFFFFVWSRRFAIELEDWSCHTVRGPLSMPVCTCKRRFMMALIPHYGPEKFMNGQI